MPTENTIDAVIALLESTDAYVLKHLGHSRRMRLRAVLTTWVWACDAAETLAIAETRIAPVVAEIDRVLAEHTEASVAKHRDATGKFKAGVLADLQDGDRAP